MKPVRFGTQAEEEWKAAVRFYHRKQSGLGLEFDAAVMSAVRLIGATPKAWPLYNPTTRKYVMPRFPYCLFYVEQSKEIVVIAVAHTSRREDYWRDRLPGAALE